MRLDLSPTGRLHLVLLDPRTRTVVQSRCVPNLVTTAGRALIADLLTGAHSVAKIELAVGTGLADGEPEPTPPSAADTGLAHEVLRIPTEREGSRITAGDPPRSVTAISAVLEAQLGGDAMELREAGLVLTRLGSGDNGDTEILYNRVVFPTITKEPELQMTLTWEVIF
jgi:hypothetical protein